MKSISIANDIFELARFRILGVGDTNLVRMVNNLCKPQVKKVLIPRGK